MNVQQLTAFFAILNDNKEAFEMFPEQFVPFGYEVLDTDTLAKFDAEIDRMYYQYEKKVKSK